MHVLVIVNPEASRAEIATDGAVSMVLGARNAHHRSRNLNRRLEAGPSHARRER